MSDKVVSKKYALREFSQVGLILVFYAFFCLYVPFAIEKYIDLPPIYYLNTYSFDTMLILRVLCIAFATFIPFLFLYISDIKNHEKNKERTKLGIRNAFVYTLVFCTIISFFTYINSSFLSYFGISTELVANIGLSIDPNFFSDYLYVFIYICFIPILEEFAFRKCLLSVLSKYGKRFAVIACSFIYAIAHSDLTQFLPSLVMAYLLSKIYLKYKSVFITSFIHVFYNLIMFLGFSVSSEYNNYVLIFILTIMLISIILVLLKMYVPIVLPYSDYNKNTFWMFISRKTVIFSLMLFIGFEIIVKLLL